MVRSLQLWAMLFSRNLRTSMMTVTAFSIIGVDGILLRSNFSRMTHFAFASRGPVDLLGDVGATRSDLMWAATTFFITDAPEDRNQI